eukprot:6272377-Prymnesium_polylepis.1
MWLLGLGTRSRPGLHVRVRSQVPLGGSVGGSVGVHSPLQLAPHEQEHHRESNICPRPLGGFWFVFALECGCLAWTQATEAPPLLLIEIK